VRALLSVYDKSGIAEFARSLHELGVELVSSGGTAKVIAEAGVPVTDVAEFTGVKPILGHRVVTLHPKIHGGILADRRDPAHLTDIENHDIDLIDLVVGNLYPFGSDPETFEHKSAQTSSEDLIDIGGPAMVRAAAKNHAFVTVLVDPADYQGVLDELREGGSTSPRTRRRLARTAFAHTAAYDAAIVSWMDSSPLVDDVLPPTIHLSLERAQDLRYGENPHQQGARYRVSGTRSWWDDVEQHGGLALSYLNLFDADAAWRLVHDLGDAPAVAIIKHANPCGVAVADQLATAYRDAFACDPVSAFGGIVALNRPIDDETVAAMVEAAQADVVIAPGYGDGVIDALVAKRKNTRLLTASPASIPELSLRQLSDGFLVQERHRFAAEPSSWEVVTERRPSEAELADAELAWRVCGHVTSNAIVLAKDGVAWGIGAGQQNRVESGAIAAQKADGRAAGGACASDAFYPFRDGIDAAAAAGVAVIIQPGGSVNDEQTIAAANEHGIAMVFTGERQFKH
jgi:phosphoribosylaminoimidazolecarboxamide formyltransferase/IMP cyclohydrolase